jgi:hypothetical protein
MSSISGLGNIVPENKNTFVDRKGFDAKCMKEVGFKPKFDWVLKEFGGWNYMKDYAQYTNLLWT